MSHMKRLVEEMMEPDQSKHNGWLDDRPATDPRHASVELQPNYRLMDGSQLVAIQGGYGDLDSSFISIDSKQALSLLAWLQQERDKLEQLAQP